MTTERFRESILPRAFTDVLSDLADLMQKELRLARAELSAKISTKVRAGLWMLVTASLALLTAFLLAQALVLWIAAAFDIALHLSCLIVALFVAAGAALAYFRGRDDAQEKLTPTRTMHQVERDISTAKEQLK